MVIEDEDIDNDSEFSWELSSKLNDKQICLGSIIIVKIELKASIIIGGTIANL